MKGSNPQLVEEYTQLIAPLLPLARRAYGTQQQGSPTRVASDKVNALILDYVDDKGGNITHLGEALRQHGLGYDAVRRRLRAARSGHVLGQNPITITGRSRGSRDPSRVAVACADIALARDLSPKEYGEAITRWYSSGISLAAIASGLNVSYFTLWAAMHSAGPPETAPVKKIAN